MANSSEINKGAWVSGAMMDPRLIQKIDADIVFEDETHAITAYRSNQLGEPLEAEYFPRKIWADREA